MFRRDTPDVFSGIGSPVVLTAIVVTLFCYIIYGPSSLEHDDKYQNGPEIYHRQNARAPKGSEFVSYLSRWRELLGCFNI